METSSSSSSIFWAISSVLVLNVLRSRFSNAECYEPNGMIVSNDMPCDPTAADSFCCATGWACLSDRVCQQIPGNIYYRGTCTDKTWSSVLCPSFCLQFNNDSSVPLKKCSGPTDAYCCDGDSNCSCDTHIDTYEPPGTPSILTTIKQPAMTTSKSSSILSASTPTVSSSSTTPSSPTASSSSTTSFPTTTTSSANTSTLNPAPASTSTLSSGTIAGIVVGAITAAIAAAALAIFAGRRGWFQKVSSHDTATTENGVLEPMMNKTYNGIPKEAEGSEVMAQLPAGPGSLAHEMPGNAR